MHVVPGNATSSVIFIAICITRLIGSQMSIVHWGWYGNSFCATDVRMAEIICQGLNLIRGETDLIEENMIQNRSRCS